MCPPPPARPKTFLNQIFSEEISHPGYYQSENKDDEGGDEPTSGGGKTNTGTLASDVSAPPGTPSMASSRSTAGLKGRRPGKRIAASPQQSARMLRAAERATPDGAGFNFFEHEGSPLARLRRADAAWKGGPSGALRVRAAEIEVGKAAAAAAAGAGAGAGTGTGAGGGVAALEQSFAALAQRTGTLEGRHKQVQAKVALLDNAFGSKASDWAQTVKHILIEREAASAAGGGGGKAGVRAGPKGGSKKTAAGGVSLQPVPSGSGNSNVRAGGGGGGGGIGSRGGNGAPHQPRDSGPGGPAETPVTTASGAGAGNGNGYEVAAGRPNTTHASGRATSTSTPKASSQGADASCTTPEVVQASHAPQGCATLVSGRCPACNEMEERCTRLEARVLESERALALLQSKASSATVAAAAAEADAAKALETVVLAAKTESNKREADALDGRQRGFGGNWAPRASVEKLASDLKQLSENTKDSEDALALVDHGLRGVRDEVCT